jgi:hypothetical protein
VRARSRAPLGLAAFLAAPLFFAALMASSLAVEKAHVFEWRRGGKLLTTWHPPDAAMEAKIWLLALVPPLLLCLWGVICMRLPYGLYLVAGGAILGSFALMHRLDLWERHHTARFPNGADLIPDSSTSSSLARGEWEANAKETAVSLSRYTIALAAGAILIALAIEVRRRRGAPPFETTAGALETGGAPQLTGPD